LRAPAPSIEDADVTEAFRAVVGPVLALLGTLFVALLGYRQWKKQQDVARYGTFLSERQAAYKELWTKLEAVHLAVRSTNFDEAEFHELVRTVNSHLMTAGLHLDRGEKSRVNDYLDALGTLGRVLTAVEANEAKSVVQQTLYDTAPIPESVLAQVKGVKEAYSAVEEKREQLIEQFRRVLGAHLFP
jgi:hypothetical protein